MQTHRQGGTPIQQVVRKQARRALVVGGLALAVGSGCSSRVDAAPGKPAAGQAAPAAAPVKADTVEVAEAKVPSFLNLTGQLLAFEDSDVAAGATGKVLSVHAERGTVVKKGDVLVKLDARTAAASAAEARAQLEVARTQRELAEADCARNEQLFQGGSVSKADHDRAQAQCRNAVAQASASEARAQLWENNLADTSIRAPFDGVVAERVVSVGEYVQPASRVVTLVATDPLRLELTVPEASATGVHQGLPVEFTLTAAPGVVYRSTVQYVGPGLRRGSRDLVVEALVPNKERQLLPGQFATVKLQLGDQALPVVPRAAVREDGAQRRLFVVRDGQLEERVVQLGEAVGQTVSVLAGVRAGERVVSVARDDLRDGLKLQ
ncbi:efflux RND transporter periplasmic adaptor subunit [Myxococcaceae bacterium GXIMD 01537]